MWSQFSRNLSLELEYLFTLMAEAALPDQLWQPSHLNTANSAHVPRSTQH